MQKDDIKVLQEIQRNTEKAMRAIDALSNKVYDDNFALHLTRQSLCYSNLHNKALQKIIEAKSEPYSGTGFETAMQVGGIHLSTLLNTSTSHIAELMMEENYKGLTKMWKTLNGNPRVEGYTMEIAKELIDFEEKSVELLRKYL